MSRISPRPKRIDKDSTNGYQIRYNRHPKRRNNLKVAEMYDCYKDGMSLGKIAWLYGMTRQNVYDLFATRGYPLRSKKKRGLTVVDGVSYTFDHAGLLRGTKDGKRVYLHRLAWEKAYGPIMADEVIVHRDGDKTNNEPSNLEALPKKLMPTIFNPEGKGRFKANPQKDRGQEAAGGTL